METQFLSDTFTKNLKKRCEEIELALVTAAADINILNTPQFKYYKRIASTPQRFNKKYVDVQHLHAVNCRW